MKLRRALFLTLALPLLLTGCGGGGDDAPPSAAPDTTEQTTTDGTEVAAPAWAVPTLSKPGPESALVMASSDFAAGNNRVAFVLVRADASAVEAPTLAVSYQPSAGAPVRSTSARLIDLGIEKTDPTDITAVYVAELTGLAVGKRWIVVEPPGEKLQGFQILDVKKQSLTPAVGERAPASANPTTATAPARKITTARPPDVELLRYSVADSIAEHIPFVVAFATPQFCQTRACGPTVDVVEAARKRLVGENARFIHIEIYEDNLPGNGPNRWVKEWNLPSEPWVFVVDDDGIVRAKFEGAVSADEIVSAMRDVLSP